MSASVSVFEYDCEAVRVVARRVNTRSGVEETRKFSVDPNLTSFDILQTILSRAFEINGDFVIAYEAPPAPSAANGEWLPLLSDWDLDTAIISAAEPSLNVIVTERKFKTLADLEEQEQFSLPPEVTSVIGGGGGNDVSSVSATSPHESPQENSNNQVAVTPGTGTASASIRPLSSLRQQLEKTIVPSLANRFQRAKTLAEETWQAKSPQLLSLLDLAGESAGPTEATDPRCALVEPLTDKDLKQFLNKVGEVVRPREMRVAVYQRGLSQHVRKVMWKHLLGVYPSGSEAMDGRGRVRYIKRKCDEYEDLKKTWVDMFLHGKVTDDLKCVTHMVKKDVLRTDRHHPFFAGEGNANVTLLYNILTTFALNHPSVSYCQGMSDLLSPLLVVMQDEGQAYLSFCALMRRLKENFSPGGEAMSRKFEHLSQGILFYDPEFYAYLKLRSADDLLYCYRWLLLEMKREFCFEDACQAIEVLWASLPPPPATTSTTCGADEGIPLFEHRFGRPCEAAADVTLTKRESVFTSLVSLRKRLSSMEVLEGGSAHGSPSIGKGRANNHRQQQQHQRRSGLDKSSARQVTTRDRIHSDGSAATAEERKTRVARHQSIKKSASLLTQSTRANRSFEKQEETTPATSGGGAGTPAAAKKVMNLNEFYKLAPASPSPVTSPNHGKNKEEGSVGKLESPQETCDGGNRGEEAEEIEEEDGYAIDNLVSIKVDRLPPPTVFGGGNPFLMFMCLACILQHRDYIMQQQLDYQEIAMHFDRMVRRHNVKRTLAIARRMFAEYLNDDWKREKMGEVASDTKFRHRNC